MKKFRKLFVLFLIFCSCSGVPEYEVEEERSQAAGYTGVINVRLKERLSKEDISKIAEELRTINDGYERLFIFYFVEGKQLYATSHYMPDLKIEME